MVWCHTGDKPLSKLMVTQFTNTYTQHWEEMSQPKQHFFYLSFFTNYLLLMYVVVIQLNEQAPL